MTNIMRKDSKKDMRLHTSKAWEIIDTYLPYQYVHLVKELHNAPEGTIRNVRNARKGNANIVRALLQVALREKAEHEKIEKLIN